jgi:hypothetical protein
MSGVISRKEAIAGRLKYYFTGKPCCHGHVSERCTKYRYCLTCSAEQSLSFYKVNLEKCRERGREWMKKNAIREKEYAKRRKGRRERINDLIAVMRDEMPDILKEFGL